MRQRGRWLWGRVQGPLRLVFFSASAVALVVAGIVVAGRVSDEPAPLVLSALALVVSFAQAWRNEWRGPKVAVLLVDSSAFSIEKRAADADGDPKLVARVVHPIVIENIGARPCVLVRFEIPSDLVGIGGWWTERMTVEGAVAARLKLDGTFVLAPGEPQVSSVTWYFEAYTRMYGKRVDLRKRVQGVTVGLGARHINLVYTASGRTVKRPIRVSVDKIAVDRAVEQLVVVSEGGEVTYPVDTSRDPIRLDFSDVEEPPSANGVPPPRNDE